MRNSSKIYTYIKEEERKKERKKENVQEYIKRRKIRFCLKSVFENNSANNF